MNTKTNDILDRIKIIFMIQNDSDLAKSLNVAKTTLSTWRQRESTPYSLCVQIANEKNISLDWLLTGEGAMYREKQEWDGVTERRGDYQVQKTGANMLTGLTDKQIRHVMDEIEEKKRLNRLEEIVLKIQGKLEK